jgi:segregation and condensation protein B
MNLENQIESILFYKNEPMSAKKLCDILEKSEAEVKEGLRSLQKNLENRGLSLLEDSDTYMLATCNQSAELIERIAKEELSKDIGKAGLETLAIILYKGGVTRREIDYVRGVNSNFILRSLMARGLIERKEGKEDARVFTYQPTLALLAHLGLRAADELPEYNKVREEIGQLNKSEENV